MNARKELLDHIADKAPVKLVRIVFSLIYKNEDDITIEGTLEEVLPLLNFDYDEGYGMAHLFGYIWYADGTWSEREEYDGSEWWRHCSCPPQNIEMKGW